MFSKKIFPSFLLLLILGLAFVVRAYRTDDLLRFYYDQGRDALVVHKMITDLQPVLVGPTTGLAGILRGPAFYYILLPAYLIGQGSPVLAALWLQIINTVGLYFFYLVAKKLFSPLAGLLAVILLGFSAHMVDLSRWLSEPSMILTSVPLLLYALIQVRSGIRPHFWWPVAALALGLSLQFEMASEIWFIPAIIGLALFSKNFRPRPQTALISLAVFFATLLPQVIFDLRHDGIMRRAVITHFSQNTAPSFGFDAQLISRRLGFYADTYAYLISPGYSWSVPLLILLFLPLLFFQIPRQKFFLPLLLLFSPLLVLLFFIGNSGNFYSYYLLGTFPLFLLLVVGLLHFYFRDRFLALIAAALFAFFLLTNGRILSNFLRQGIDGPSSITIANQIEALDWIYQKAAGQPFNVDIYVPPVIPYSYDYLFSWHGQKKYGYTPNPTPQTLEFTLFESDPQSVRFPDWYTANTADHPLLLDQFSSGGVHVDYRQKKSLP